MIGSKKATGIFGSFVVVGLLAASASAGILGTGLSYNDGMPWEGSTSYSSGGTLTGSVEWAVFAPGRFPFSGYTPTPGEFTYVYQVLNSGTAAVSSFGVGIENVADMVGTFVDEGHGVTGNSPSAMDVYLGDSVFWSFVGDGHSIAKDCTSCGLVVSSPTAPLDYYGGILNHGEFALVVPVPSPGPNSIPEPATLWLLGSGVCAMMVRGWFRRG